MFRISTNVFSWFVWTWTLVVIGNRRVLRSLK